MAGLPEGIAQFRRDLTLELLMYSSRITQKRYRRRLIEAVIPQGSPLVGVPLGSRVFRDQYSATIVGIRPAALFDGLAADVTSPPSNAAGTTRTRSADANEGRRSSRVRGSIIVGGTADMVTHEFFEPTFELSHRAFSLAVIGSGTEHDTEAPDSDEREHSPTGKHTVWSRCVGAWCL
jgi:hypothetical protein